MVAGRIAPGGSALYRLPLPGGKLAEIAAMGEEGAEVQIALASAEGTVICEDAGEVAYCAFVPGPETDAE